MTTGPHSQVGQIDSTNDVEMEQQEFPSPEPCYVSPVCGVLDSTFTSHHATAVIISPPGSFMRPLRRSNPCANLYSLKRISDQDGTADYLSASFMSPVPSTLFPSPTDAITPYPSVDRRSSLSLHSSASTQSLRTPSPNFSYASFSSVCTSSSAVEAHCVCQQEYSWRSAFGDEEHGKVIHEQQHTGDDKDEQPVAMDSTIEDAALTTLKLQKAAIVRRKRFYIDIDAIGEAKDGWPLHDSYSPEIPQTQ